MAKELAEIPEDEDVTLVNYPEKKGLLDMVLGGGSGKAAMRWMLYRFIREDLAQSLQMLSSGVAPLMGGAMTE